MTPKIRSKSRGQLTTGVLLFHNNVRPHTAHATVAKSRTHISECLLHPPHSPDLAPSGFHVFWAIKLELTGTEFRSDEEVQETIHDWICKQQKDFFFKSDSDFSQASEQIYFERNGEMLKNNKVLTAILINKIYLQRF
jgi:hypothetical protein